MALTFEPEPQNTIPFLPERTVPEITDDAARTRAAKYDYTLGEQSPGEDALYFQIAEGNEETVRNRMALDKHVKDQQIRLNIIQKLSEKGPLTEQQFEFIKGLTDEQLANPQTIFESEYAKKVFSDTLFTNTHPETGINGAIKQNPDKTDALLDHAEKWLGKFELGRKRWEEIDKTLKDSPFINPNPLQKGLLDLYLAEWIPFYRDIAMSSGQNIFLGEDLHKQYDKLRDMDLDTFQIEFNKRVDDLYRINPLFAKDFIEGFFNESNQSQLWNNLSLGIDVASVLPFGLIGKALKGKAAVQTAAGLTKAEAGEVAAHRVRINAKFDAERSELDDILKQEGRSGSDPDYQAHVNRIEKARAGELAELNQIVDDHLKATANTIREVVDAAQSGSPAKVLAAAGKTQESAQVAAAQSARIDAGLTKFSEQASDLVRHMPSVLDPNHILKGPYSLAQTAATALAEGVRNLQRVGFETIANRLGIERVTTEQALAYGLAKTAASLKAELNINDAIARVQYVPVLAEKGPTNTYHMAVDISKPDGSLFPTKEAAGYFARKTIKLPEKGYEFRKQGDGYYVRVSRPVDETDQGFRNLLIDTLNETPSGVKGVNRALGILRSADQLLGEHQREARKVLIHGLSLVQKAMQDMAQPILALSKSSRADLNRFLTHLRDEIKLTPTEEVGGQYVTTLHQFEQKWIETNNRLPTAAEAHAYFAHLNMYDFQWSLMNFAAYRDLARQGMTRAKIGDVEFYAKYQDAAKMWELYNNRQQFSILEMSDAQTGVYWGYQQMNKKMLEVFETKIGQGYKFVQIGDPLSRPLKNVDGRIINFVLTKNVSQRHLNLDIFPYHPGGHTQYDYRHSVVQPRLNPIEGRNIFAGDVNLFHVQTKKEADELAQALNDIRSEWNTFGEQSPKVRQMIESRLPVSYDEFVNAVTEEKITMRHPFSAVPQGKTSIDNPKFKENLGTHMQDFREHELDLVKWIGKVKDDTPLFRLDAQKTLDPMVALQRQMNRVARNAYLEDYQILSAEEFAAEFWDVLDVPRHTLQANPIPYIMNPKFAENIDPAKKALAWNKSQIVRNLLHTNSWIEQKTAVLRGKLYEAIYDKYGAKAADVVNGIASAHIFRNPFSFARTAAVHMKIGMFNPKQYFTQLQTTSITASIAGAEVAYKSTGVMMLQKMMELNGVEHIDHYAGLARKLGWKPEWFKEVWELGDKSGIRLVEGEHIFNEGYMAPKLTGGVGGKILDWGQSPWRAGERQNRMIALNAAYLEWRKANPEAIFNRRAQYDVLRRQDLMTGNMTRASQSMLQQGATGKDASIFTELSKNALQFASYQMRVWELMTGHTLTKAEKVRVLATQAMLYGVPVAAGTVLPWPWFDQIRKWMLDAGVANPEPWVEFLTTGLFGLAFHAITGKETDVSSQWGSPSFSMLHDAMEGKWNLIEIFGGASSSVIGQIAATTYPVIQDLWKIQEPGMVPVFVEDLGDLAKSISSVSNGMKLYYAMTAHKAISKNEIEMTDVTGLDGLFMLFGISPEAVNDVGRLIEIKDSAEEAKVFAGQQIAKYLRQWAKTDINTPEHEANYRMALHWRIVGGLQPDEFNQVLRRVTSEDATLFDRLNSQMFLEKFKKGER